MKKIDQITLILQIKNRKIQKEKKQNSLYGNFYFWRYLCIKKKDK